MGVVTSRNPFQFLVPGKYIWNSLSYKDFKFGARVDHSKSQLTDDKLSLKGRGHVTL